MGTAALHAPSVRPCDDLAACVAVLIRAFQQVCWCAGMLCFGSIFHRSCLHKYYDSKMLLKDCMLMYRGCV